VARALARQLLLTELSAEYRGACIRREPCIQMTTLTIRRLDPTVKQRLRLRAAQYGRSIEDEARRILSERCGQMPRAESLADIALRLFGNENGVELELPERQAGCEGVAPDPT
jgi:plasmid stability protein